jgi:hypothetical protein
MAIFIWAAAVLRSPAIGVACEQALLERRILAPFRRRAVKLERAPEAAGHERRCARRARGPANTKSCDYDYDPEWDEDSLASAKTNVDGLVAHLQDKGLTARGQAFNAPNAAHGIVNQPRIVPLI